MSLRICVRYEEEIARLRAIIDGVAATRIHESDFEDDDGEERVRRECLECGAKADGPAHRPPELDHLSTCSVGPCDGMVVVVPGVPQLHRDPELLEKVARHVPARGNLGPEERVRAAAAILFLIDAEVLR